MTKLVVAAAAALVAATLPPGCASTASPAPARPLGSPAATAHTTSVASVAAPSPEEATRHRVQQVLDRAPVVPGARRAGRSPARLLARPMQTIASPNVVTSTRWWTAPGTVADALRYLRAHPPTGLHANGRGLLTTPHGDVADVEFDGRPTAAYRQVTLVVAVTRHGAGVAVRADAEAVWVPARTAAEHIDAATLTAVDVTVDRSEAAPTVHRTVTGARARRLARVLNRLPVQTPGTRSCFLDHGYVDSLVFHGAGPDVVVRADPGGCMVVQVRVAGHPQPTLMGGGVVDAAIVKALALPAAYRR